MHEFSIAENIFRMLEDIVKEQDLAKIDKINLQVGALLHIVDESLIFSFNAIKRDSEFKETRLFIEKIPVTVKCRACLNVFELNYSYICPKCNAGDVDIISGKELIIKSIEGE